MIMYYTVAGAAQQHLAVQSLPPLHHTANPSSRDLLDQTTPMHHPYTRAIPIPLRLQPSKPPTEAELTSRQDAWCEWVWQHEYDPYKTDKRPILRAFPRWKDNGAQIPTEDQIYNLLVNYTMKMKPEDVPLIANNPHPQGYQVCKYSSSRFNVHYLLIKQIPRRSDIPDENSDPIRVCESTGDKFWPATETKHSSYDRLIRIKMPWAPYYGVENEVANMLFAAQNSRIRVPDIYCFNSSGKNILGLDFIVMERIPGLSGSEVIQTTSSSSAGIRSEDHRGVTRSVMAQFRDRTQAFSKQLFNTIGSLYCNCNWDTETSADHPPDSPPGLPQFFVGPLVDPAFFGPMLSKKNTCMEIPTKEGGNARRLLPHRDVQFSYGPFLNTKSYLTSLIKAHLLRDWSKCKPPQGRHQRQQDDTQEDKASSSLKMTTTSLISAYTEAITLWRDMEVIMKLPRGGKTKLPRSTAYMFAAKFSLSDLSPGGMILTEQGNIFFTSTRQDSLVRERRAAWKWYRLKAVTEWDTARVMPYTMSRDASRTPPAPAAGQQGGSLRNEPSTFVHMLSWLSLREAHEGCVRDDDSIECGRRLRGLEKEIRWLCTVEMPKFEDHSKVFI